MPYTTIHTSHGLSVLAAAATSGIPINLTHFAVGDGSGAEVTPSVSQTALVNERWRTTVNTLIQDPTTPTKYYIEAVIPATIGGWVIREFGIFDDDGLLVAVGSFPATYKPVPLDGAVNDLVIRVEVIVSNAGVISIVLDPAVAIATRSWVLATINGAYLIPGGTTGQVLTKDSNADGDFSWQAPDVATVLVDTIEEPVQSTSASQVTFNLTATTTVGLAVYIDGIRIPRIPGVDGWQQGASTTQVVLGQAYPAGSQFFAVQNEPSGQVGTPLQAPLNLSDLQSAATARTNLGVYSKTEADQLQPAGNVAFTARTTPPSGWLAANGALVSRTTYAALFAAIGTTYGAGNGTTTFALPDLRGEFLRGWDSGRGVDTGRALGSAQADALKAHTHSIPAGNYTTHGFILGGGNAFATDLTSTTGSTGGSETRPRNVAMLAIIKF